jgi:uncharacterized RDD family membrane protein YckC
MKVTTDSFDRVEVFVRPCSDRRIYPARFLPLHIGGGKLAGLASIILVGAALFATAAHAQTDKEPNATAPLDLKVEDSDTASKTNRTDWWDSDTDWEGNEVHGVRKQTVVSIRNNAELKADDWAETVVAIGGSATALGKVRDVVVAIAGDVTVDNHVTQAVAVLGDVTAGPGARIRDEIVAVGGNVTIKKGAKVHRDVTAVGGRVFIEDGATVDGRVNEIDLSAIGFPRLNWLRGWFKHCFLLMRPLAPQVGWVWVIAIGLLAFYFAIAALFPRPVLACVNELTRRPATTFFMGLLTKLLFLPVLLILSATGVGLLVAPFLFAALLIGVIVGKVGLLQFIGLKIGKHSSTEALHHPLVGLLIGAIIITLLYLVPFVGILTLSMAGIWGLGGAVVAAFGGMRREAAEKAALRKAATPPSTPSTGQPGPIENPNPAMESSNPAAGAAAGQGTVPPVAAPLPSSLPASITDELAYPRAGFWERMGAAFLDMVIVGVLGGLVHVAPLGLLIGVAYFAGMWTWKQTTIGGIVIGLKVVRIDGRPFTFVTAIVRALAAIFSVIVFFFGFIWIGWDVEKQGWHDKIAGTVVVRLPRAVPLVCL